MMSRWSMVHESGNWDGVNVRAGNAVQQRAFRVRPVPRQRKRANSGRASDCRDSAEAEGGRPDDLGVHLHRRCNPHYFSRAGAGAFLRSVWREGPYEEFDERRGRSASSLIDSVRLHDY